MREIFPLASSVSCCHGMKHLCFRRERDASLHSARHKRPCHARAQRSISSLGVFCSLLSRFENSLYLCGASRAKRDEGTGPKDRVPPRGRFSLASFFYLF